MTLIGATARYAARMRGPLIPRRTDRGFRLVFGSDYFARQGFKVPRARSESFPNAPEAAGEIEFLTVNAGFEPSQKRRVDMTLMP